MIKVTTIPDHCRRVRYLMAEESSSTTAVMTPHHPTVLDGTDTSQNLIVLNINAQAPLKLTATNYSTWRLQFTSLLFRYDLLGFFDYSKLCPPIMIILPDAAPPLP